MGINFGQNVCMITCNLAESRFLYTATAPPNDVRELKIMCIVLVLREVVFIETINYFS